MDSGWECRVQAGFCRQSYLGGRGVRRQKHLRPAADKRGRTTVRGDNHDKTNGAGQECATIRHDDHDDHDDHNEQGGVDGAVGAGR